MKMTAGADRRRGGRTDNDHGRGRDVDGRVLRRAVTDHDGVAQFLVESGQGRRAQHYLVVRVDSVPGEDRRPEVGVCSGQQHGHGEAVDLNVAERVPGPGGHLRVSTDEVVWAMPRGCRR